MNVKPNWKGFTAIAGIIANVMAYPLTLTLSIAVMVEVADTNTTPPELMAGVVAGIIYGVIATALLDVFDAPNIFDTLVTRSAQARKKKGTPVALFFRDFRETCYAATFEITVLVTSLTCMMVSGQNLGFPPEMATGIAAGVLYGVLTDAMFKGLDLPTYGNPLGKLIYE